MRLAGTSGSRQPPALRVQARPRWHRAPRCRRPYDDDRIVVTIDVKRATTMPEISTSLGASVSTHTVAEVAST